MSFISNLKKLPKWLLSLIITTFLIILSFLVTKVLFNVSMEKADLKIETEHLVFYVTGSVAVFLAVFLILSREVRKYVALLSLIIPVGLSLLYLEIFSDPKVFREIVHDLKLDTLGEQQIYSIQREREEYIAVNKIEPCLDKQTERELKDLKEWQINKVEKALMREIELDSYEVDMKQRSEEAIAKRETEYEEERRRQEEIVRREMESVAQMRMDEIPLRKSSDDNFSFEDNLRQYVDDELVRANIVIENRKRELATTGDSLDFKYRKKLFQIYDSLQVIFIDSLQTIESIVNEDEEYKEKRNLHIWITTEIDKLEDEER